MLSITDIRAVYHGLCARSGKKPYTLAVLESDPRLKKPAPACADYRTKIIFISSEFINTMRLDDELLEAVLAHEHGHIDQARSWNPITQSARAISGLYNEMGRLSHLTVGALSGAFVVTTAIAGPELDTPFTQQPMAWLLGLGAYWAGALVAPLANKHLEHDADRRCFKMTKHNGMQRVLQRVSQRYSDKFGYFHTHPTDKSRIQRLKRLAQKQLAAGVTSAHA